MAPKTLSPGAAREIHEPVLENDARRPDFVVAPTERPPPPRPFELTGWSRAAGYSTGFPSSNSFPAAATTSTSCAAAYSSAFRSTADVSVPPIERLITFAPGWTGET